MGLEGFVDRIDNRWIVGWAWRSEEPDTPVAIDVLVDGIRVDGCRADMYRADLQAAGKGNGRHAFEMKLPSNVNDGNRHEIRLLYSGTDRDLVGSPFRPQFAATHLAPPAQSEAGQAGAVYHSRFGGLWTDLSNADDVIEGKRSLGWISPTEADLLTLWVKNGFVILRGAVPLENIDRLDGEVEAIWNGASPSRYFVESWNDDVRTVEPAGPRFRDQRVKLLDLYAQSEAARSIVFAPAVVRFLALLFERPALAFQSLYFRWGSKQEIHQDSAFVKVSSPMELVASWVALEDITPGSGELEYYVGSHRLEDYLFDGALKWMPFRSDEYARFLASLHERSRARGLERQQFLPRKGDVLIWSADLAHGGCQDVTRDVTRKSLVTHYCPGSCRPIYADGERRYPIQQFNDAAYYTVPVRE